MRAIRCFASAAAIAIAGGALATAVGPASATTAPKAAPTGPISIAQDAPVTPGLVAPPESGGSAPDCSSLIYPTAIKYNTPDPQYQPTGYTGATFRMVGVDLSKYLGASGHGTIDFYIDTQKAAYSEGTYNASGQSGASFGPFTISPWAAYEGINNPRSRRGRSWSRTGRRSVKHTATSTTRAR